MINLLKKVWSQLKGNKNDSKSPSQKLANSTLDQEEIKDSINERKSKNESYSPNFLMNIKFQRTELSKFLDLLVLKIRRSVDTFYSSEFLGKESAELNTFRMIINPAETLRVL